MGISTPLPPPPIQVIGRVVDEKGQPLQGVSVVVKGTRTGTQTEADGRFVLNVPNNNSVLVISSVYFESKEISINGSTDLGTISLVASITALNEIVVTGYSITKRVIPSFTH